MEAVARAGIELNLYGAGWDICDWINLPNVHYYGKIRPEEVLKHMYDSKIVLNTMSWFKEGSRERVFNGMIHGAIAATDKSGYILDEFDESEMIIYDISDTDSLIHKIENVLGCPDKAQIIADKGRKKAVNSHTWQARARELHEDLISKL